MTGWSVSLDWLISSTMLTMPPSKWNSLCCPVASKVRTMRNPGLRYATSLKRWASVSKSKATVSKIWSSGAKVMVVPWSEAGPTFSSGPATLPSVELHHEAAAVAAHFRPQPPAQEVHHGGAHAVQPAGDPVAAPAELRPCVEGRQHRLQRGEPRGTVHVHGNASPVVRNLNGVVRPDHHLCTGAEARHRLVHCVVHYLVDQVVQAPVVGAAYVHTGAAAHGLPPPAVPGYLPLRIVVPQSSPMCP